MKDAKREFCSSCAGVYKCIAQIHRKNADSPPRAVGAPIGENERRVLALACKVHYLADPREVRPLQRRVDAMCVI